MIIASIKTNFTQEIRNNAQQQQSFVMTKHEAKDTFQCTNIGMQPTFKGELNFARMMTAKLDEDIEKAIKAQELHKIPNLYLEKAKVESRSGQKKEAIKSLRNILRSIYDNVKNNPKDKPENYLEVLKEKADLEMGMGLINYAVRTFKKIVKLEPKDRINHINLINQQIKSSKKEEVYKSFDRALKFFPDNMEFLDGKAGFAKKMKDFPETIKILKRMIEIDPYETKFYERKAMFEKNILLDSGAAIQTMEEAIKVNPKHKGLYYTKAIIESHSDDLFAAIKTLAKGIEVHPDEKGFFDMKNRLQARIEKELKIDKIKSYLDKANLEYLEGNSSSAIKIISEGIENYPNLSLFYNQRGVYHFNKKDFDKAEKDFDIALKKSSGKLLKSQIFYNKSLICTSREEDEAAVDFLEESLRLNPKNEGSMFAVYMQVSKYILKSDMDAANGVLKRMAKVVPENMDLHIFKIHINAATEDFAEAFEGFQPLFNNKKYSTNPLILGYSAALRSQLEGNQEMRIREELAKSRLYLKTNESLLPEEVNMVNGLEKFTMAKLQGKNVEFPVSTEDLKDPKYEPKIKSEWDNFGMDNFLDSDDPLF